VSGIWHGALVGTVALGVGLTCGVLNIRLLATVSRRVVDSANSKPFAISSLFRVAAFGIVAGVFAAYGPWWSMALYLVGLLLPYAFHVAHVWREL
jgi:hypothetical protein